MTTNASIDDVVNFAKAIVTATGATLGTLPTGEAWPEIKAKHLNEFSFVPVELDNATSTATHKLASLWALTNKYLSHSVKNPSALRSIISTHILDAQNKSMYLRCPPGSGTLNLCSTPTARSGRTVACSCSQLKLKVKTDDRTITSPLFGARFQDHDEKIKGFFSKITATAIKSNLSAADLSADIAAVRKMWVQCTRRTAPAKLKSRTGGGSSSSSSSSSAGLSTQKRFKRLNSSVATESQVVSAGMVDSAEQMVNTNPEYAMAQVDVVNGFLPHAPEASYLDNSHEGNALLAQVIKAQMYVNAFSKDSPARRTALANRTNTDETTIKLNFDAEVLPPGSTSAAAIIVESSPTIAAAPATAAQ